MRLTACLLLLATACGDDTTPSDSGTATSDSGTTSGADLANGQSIYEGTCASGYCHGGDTTIQDRVPDMSDSELETQITEGGNGMPSQDSLSADDVTDVVAYLRGEFG